MKDLIPIGRFSQVARLSIPTLRYYDEVGLLHPAAVDPGSSYRYYRLAQVRDAETIRLFRSLDVPLGEIERILRESSPEAIDGVLAQHMARVEARVAADLRILSGLRRLRGDAPEGDYPDVRVAMLDAADALCVHACVPEHDVSGVVRAITRELLDHLDRPGHEAVGPPGALFPDAGQDEAAVHLTVFVPADCAVARSGRIVPQVLPGGRAAVVTHLGPYTLLDRTYGALLQWVQFHGYQLIGPPREVYWTGPLDANNPNEYRTEIVWQIRQP